jgi:hypothetical protein
VAPDSYVAIGMELNASGIKLEANYNFIKLLVYSMKLIKDVFKE